MGHFCCEYLILKGICWDLVQQGPPDSNQEFFLSVLSSTIFRGKLTTANYTEIVNTNFELWAMEGGPED